MNKEKIEKLKENEVAQDIHKDLERISEIDALADSEGGKILCKSLTRDILDAVHNLANNNEKLTMQEFIAIGQRIKANRDLIEVLAGARKNKEFLEGLLEEQLGE